MENKLWYIFLDVDGVLDDENYFMKCYNHHKVNGIMSMNHFPFNPESLYNLMILVQYIQNHDRQVKIILSSTWRLRELDIEIVKHRLAEYGLRIADKTENLGRRGDEIISFLSKNKEFENYIVLDDDINDIKDIVINENICRTDFMEGFNNEKLLEALNIVNSIIYK